jgi:hypothetical protein
MLAVVVVSVGGLRCVRAHQQPRAPTVPLEACVTATWNGFCFVCTVGRSSGKLVSLMGVLRPGTGKLQSGSAGLDLRKATCGPVPTYDIAVQGCWPAPFSPDLPAEGEPDGECHSNDGQNDGFERTSAPCRTPTAGIGAPAARL